MVVNRTKKKASRINKSSSNTSSSAAAFPLPSPSSPLTPPCNVDTRIPEGEESLLAPLRAPGWRGVVNRWYLNYVLCTSLLVMEPWEARLFNSLVISILVMSLYTFLVFFPPYALNFLVYTGVLSNGQDIAMSLAESLNLK